MINSKKFNEEHAIFQENREKWLTEGKAGQYVIINGQEVLGFFVDASLAFQAGLNKYGAGEFFMSAVLPSDATDISFFGAAV